MRQFLSVFAVLAVVMVFFAVTEQSIGGDKGGSSGKVMSQDALAKKIEDYLSNLDTVEARFVQIGPTGQQVSGKFYMDRPGKLRFQYDAPINDYIVADGFFIYFYDSEMGQQNHAPIDSTLAYFFLRRDVSLHEDVTVTNVVSTEKVAEVTIVQTKEPESGALTLVFDMKPKMRLKSWHVQDAQGMVTTILLDDIKTDVKLASDLFYYRDNAGNVLNP